MDTIGIDGMHYRYYKHERVVPFDEDLTHEFKGHLNFTKEQVPPHAQDIRYDRPSRQPISKTVNAFVNSERGGTVYLGIADDGRILGIVMNQHTMEHVLQNVDDMMARYNPPVAPHRYSVEFVPVVEADSSQEDIKKIVTFKPSDHADETMRGRPHSLRTYTSCWCHKVLSALMGNGFLLPQYVVEVHVKPWDRADPRNHDVAVGNLRAHPIYENEEGRAFCRGDASIREFSVAEAQALACRVTLDYYNPIETRLKEQRQELLREIHELAMKNTNVIEPQKSDM